MDDSNPQLELPPGEATLLCECGFQSEPFCFVEHLYRCISCHAINSPSKIPFVYQPPTCSVCGHQFERTDRVHASWMRPAYCLGKRNTNESPDYASCPKCSGRSLAVNSLCVDYQVYENDFVTPVVGSLLHARTMKSDDSRIALFFWSPRLSSDYSLSLSITNREPNAIVDGHHEFRVIAVSEFGPYLTIEYIRQLAPKNGTGTPVLLERRHNEAMQTNPSIRLVGLR